MNWRLYYEKIITSFITNNIKCTCRGIDGKFPIRCGCD